MAGEYPVIFLCWGQGDFHLGRVQMKKTPSPMRGSAIFHIFDITILRKSNKIENKIFEVERNSDKNC